MNQELKDKIKSINEQLNVTHATEIKMMMHMGRALPIESRQPYLKAVKRLEQMWQIKEQTLNECL